MSISLAYAYFDTSALMRRVEANVANPFSRNQKIAERVTRLLDDSNVVGAVSEHVLLELHNSIAIDWRKSDSPEFDQGWAERSFADVMQLIAGGKLTIVPMPPKAAEQAMTLVTIATRDYDSNFRAWDAVHLLTATAWAYEVGTSVDLITTDTDFERFIALFSSFRGYVNPLNLDN
jgi:hypothetical protein